MERVARRYQMVERARSVEQTRRAILDAAGQLFAGEAFVEVTIDDVATAAEVSRGTIYHQFGSKQGLFDALTTWMEERAHFASIAELAAAEDPVEALVEVCAAIVRFVHQTAPLFTNLRALAVVDPDLRAMVQRKDDARRRLIGGLVQRVPVDRLRVPRVRARALVQAMTSYEAVEELLGAGRSVGAAQDDMRWFVGEFMAR